MISDVIRLHPEVEEILRELAARPDSTLLRVRTDAAQRALAETHPRADPNSALIHAAERHLVEVYREELAFALRQAAWCKLATSAAGVRSIYRRRTLDDVLSVPSAHELGKSASDVLRSTELRATHSPELQLLEACVGSPTEAWATPEQLCAAAHRVRPTPNGRGIAASAFALSGRPVAALECAATVSAGVGEVLIRASVLTNSVQAWLELGRIDEAVDAARRGARLAPELIGAQVNYLWCALLVESEHAAAECVDGIEQATRGDPRLVDEAALLLARSRTVNAPHSSATRAQMIQRLRDGSSAAARRVLDGLQ